MNELEQRIREKKASVQEILAATKKPEKPEKDKEPDPNVAPSWKERPFGNAWDNFNQRPPSF